jgi:hypothetical protein
MFTKKAKDSLTGETTESSSIDVIKRERGFCSSLKESSTRTKDSLALFRGTSNKLLNTLLANTMPPLDENNWVNKRVPELNIKLEHIYGFEVDSHHAGLR